MKVFSYIFILIVFIFSIRNNTKTKETNEKNNKKKHDGNLPGFVIDAKRKSFYTNPNFAKYFRGGSSMCPFATLVCYEILVGH